MSESGTQIGAYTIESEIGRGGMGVVYKGTDSRLGRTVAIKALPEHFAQDPDRLARFEREARTLASLSHANVAGIYGVEEHEGHRYLILEFVEGMSLAERLDAGPLSVDEALETCAQIAAGVEAAHEAGVIHRDLKPANIKITPDGQAKVLDFGLARTEETSSSGSSISQLPTMATPAGAGSPTMPGAVLGTAPYMSPEQARGRRVDKRADIWSLGVVLYECLTGASPFVGETMSDSIGAILHKDVDLDTLPAGTPRRARQLLERMLTKDKAHRMRDAGDVWIELEASRQDLAQGVVEEALQVTSPASIVRTLTFLAVLVIAVIATAVATNALSGSSVASDADSLSSRVVRMSRLTSDSGIETYPQLTPDGNTLIYVRNDGDDIDIYSVRVGGLNAQNLTGRTPGIHSQPAISPDGQRIAYRSDRSGVGIWVMGATGESPRRLTDFGANPAWSPDGERIVFATEAIDDPSARSVTSELWVVESDGGEPTRIFAGDAVQPVWSPGGERIAFWGLRGGGGQRDLFTVSATGDDLVQLTNDPPTDWSPRWSPDGKWLYFSSDRNGATNLWRVPMDESAGRAVGEAEAVTIGDAAALLPAFDAGGARLVTTLSRSLSHLVRLPFDPATDAPIGDVEVVIGGSQIVGLFDVSSDGRRIALTLAGAQEDLAVMDDDGSGLRLLTSDAAKDRGAIWAPDNETILSYSDRSGRYEIYEINRDGSGMQAVTDIPGPLKYYPTYKPGDANTIYYYSDVGVHRVVKEDDGVARTAERIATPPEGWAPLMRRWSPDGHRLLGSNSLLQSNTKSSTVYYDFEEDSWEVVMESGADADWLTDSAIIVIRGRDLVRKDLETGDERVIYTLAPEYSFGTLMFDRATYSVYFVRSRVDADIWLLELEHPE